MDKDKLRSIVQNLFLENGFTIFFLISQDHWRLKDLADRTEQPVQFLKEEVLNDLCILNKKGKFQSTYQLKPEYRSHTRPSMEEADEFEEIE
jgi:hypothetical protein